MLVIYQNPMGELVATDKEIPELEIVAYSNEYGITDRPLNNELTLIELDLSIQFLGVCIDGLIAYPKTYGIFKYINPQLN